MSHFDKEMGQQLEGAFSQIGLSMMSDDFAAKLLAYVYVMGGGNEAVAMNPAMIASIGMAQQKFNILGGKIPNEKGISLLRERIRELETGMDKTEWLNEIFKRYGFKLQKRL